MTHSTRTITISSILLASVVAVYATPQSIYKKNPPKPVVVVPAKPHKPSVVIAPKKPNRVIVPVKQPVIIAPRHSHAPVRTVPHGALKLSWGGSKFFFQTGVFYKWQHDQYVVSVAPVGATVTVLPTGCRAFTMNGRTYYEMQGSYFCRVNNGYQVVQKPVQAVIATSQQVSGQQITIWVQNDNGSSTPVNLTSSNGSWVGPKGEYYRTLPTSDQLKPVYGIR